MAADETDAEVSDQDMREILRRRARSLSEVPGADDGGEKISLVVFQLHGEEFGIETRHLLEARQSVPLRRVPHAPPHLLGIVNLRGELVPVIDLSPVLGLPPQKVEQKVAALLVLSGKKAKFGCAVERARALVTFSLKELKPPPLSLEAQQAVLTRGTLLYEERIVSLLDTERIVSELSLAGEKTQPV